MALSLIRPTGKLRGCRMALSLIRPTGKLRGCRMALSLIRPTGKLRGCRMALSLIRPTGKLRGCRMALSLIRPTGKDTWLPDGAAAYRAYRKCYVGPIRRSRHRAISATSDAWRSAIQMPVHALLPLLFSGATLQAASRQPVFQIPVARTMAHSTSHRGRWSA